MLIGLLIDYVIIRIPFWVFSKAVLEPTWRYVILPWYAKERPVIYQIYHHAILYAKGQHTEPDPFKCVQGNCVIIPGKA